MWVDRYLSFCSASQSNTWTHKQCSLYPLSTLWSTASTSRNGVLFSKGLSENKTYEETVNTYILVDIKHISVPSIKPNILKIPKITKCMNCSLDTQCKSVRKLPTNLSLKDFHVSTIKSSSNEIHLNYLLLVKIYHWKYLVRYNVRPSTDVKYSGLRYSTGGISQRRHQSPPCPQTQNARTHSTVQGLHSVCSYLVCFLLVQK